MCSGDLEQCDRLLGPEAGAHRSHYRHLKRGRYESGFIVKAGLFEGGNYLNSPTLCHTPVVTKGAPPRLAGKSSPRVLPEAPGHVPSLSTFIWPWDKKKDWNSHILQTWYSGSAGKELFSRAPSLAEPPTQR